MSLNESDLTKVLPAVKAERRTLKTDLQKAKHLGRAAFTEMIDATNALSPKVKKGVAGVAATGAILAGGALAANALEQPTHVEQLKVQIDKAKANPQEMPEGKYVTFMVGANQNPTTIANELAPGDSQDHAEVYDEVLAQEDSNGTLQQGPILIESQHITNQDPAIQSSLGQPNQ
ncbi:MAG TPA: hypothetical protein VN031_03820 [Candidatus Microsaccharimonas sp.]|nr:hypothetical protein [Candidatus Microsaccharimonas sp.]